MDEQMKRQVTLAESEEAEVEIDLVELVYYLRSKLFWLLLCLIIGAVIAGAVTKLMIAPKYEATSKVYMVSASTDSVVDLTDLNLGTSLSSDYRHLLQTRPIIESMIRDLELEYEYETLISMLRIETISDTRIIAITTTSTDPEEAMVISNSLADRAVTYLPQLMETSEPNIAEYAVYPTNQSSPSFKKNVALGGIGAMAVCMLLFCVHFLMDDTIKSAEDVEKMFGVMPLTIIPEIEVESISDKKEELISKRKKKEAKKRKKRKKGED